MATEIARADELQVYEPHKVGLPPLGPYLRDVWRRRQLVVGLARANLRSQNYNTMLGQLWLVLNPLFLALVLFALVTIVRGGSRGMEFMAHLTLCLFAFRLVSASVNQGAKSVTKGGRLILNMAFPRVVLPLEAVLRAFLRFLPTLLVYAAIQALAGIPVTPQVLWGIPIIATLVVFALGAAMLVATAQVYFRDLANFLRYFTRLWLYASPVIYYADEVPDQLEPMLYANPLYPPLTALSQAVTEGLNPSPGLLLASLAWAAAALVAGGLFFISREREFAIRL